MSNDARANLDERIAINAQINLIAEILKDILRDCDIYDVLHDRIASLEKQLDKNTRVAAGFCYSND